MTDLFPLMLECAIMAARHGYCSEAESIIDAIAMEKKGNASLAVARALIKIYGNDPRSAIDILSHEIPEKDNSIARAYLGLAHRLNGDETTGKGILDEVLAASNDSAIGEFCRSIRDVPAHVFLKV